MQTPQTRLTLNVAMQPQALYSLPDAADVQIQCDEGAVWVTLDDDPRDVVLETGQVFSASEHRRVLISALSSSRVSVSRREG